MTVALTACGEGDDLQVEAGCSDCTESLDGSSPDPEGDPSPTPAAPPKADAPSAEEAPESEETVNAPRPVTTTGPELCHPRTTRPCGIGIGRCVVGRQACGPDRRWRECMGSLEPVEELCNGVDDDCDGVADEDFALGDACSGACGAGVTECVDGWSACSTSVGGSDFVQSDEVCDGVDQDCDGIVDEGVDNACGLCGAVPEEVCDCEDNDCDFFVDEETLGCPPCE